VRVLRTTVGGALAVTGALLLAPAGAGAAPSAAALYREAMATTRSWTVHYTSESIIKKVPYIESGDAGPASGTQTIRFGRGATADDADLIEIGSLTFLKGNEQAMVDLAGLSPTQAAATQNHWVLFSTDNPSFSQVVAGVRSHDVATEVELDGPYSLGPTRTLDGHRVDAIRGTQSLAGLKKARAVLYVQASGRHLLVEEDSIGTGGKPNGDERIVLSKWGERVRPKAPQASVTLGAVTAA
jgi:hypothetical protein